MRKLLTATLVATVAMHTTAKAGNEKVTDWELIDGRPLAHQERVDDWYTERALATLDTEKSFSNTEGMNVEKYSGLTYSSVGEGIALIAMDIETVTYSNFKNVIQRVCDAVRDYPNDTDYLKGVREIRVTNLEGFNGYSFMGGRSACFRVYSDGLEDSSFRIRALSEARSFTP